MPDPTTLERGAQAAALVTNMAVSTAALGWLGHWLDTRFETAPWLLVIGISLGFSAGMFALFKGLSRLNPDDDDESPHPEE